MYPWIEEKLKEIREASPADRGLQERQDCHIKQYEETGFCSMDMWSLDVPIAKFILPRIKYFYEVVVKDNSTGSYGPKKDWELIMWTFEKIANDDARWVSKEEAKKIQKGLRVFGKYLLVMWC